MMFDDLNERGLRDGLIALVDTKNALRGRLQDAETQVAVHETAATALRKIQAFLEQIEGHMRGRLELIERKKKEEQT
jgi:hypothetical protein